MAKHHNIYVSQREAICGTEAITFVSKVYNCMIFQIDKIFLIPVDWVSTKRRYSSLEALESLPTVAISFICNTEHRNIRI